MSFHIVPGTDLLLDLRAFKTSKEELAILSSQHPVLLIRRRERSIPNLPPIELLRQQTSSAAAELHASSATRGQCFADEGM